MSALRSTRQDAQINYLSTLSIFMKQTTYLATLPNFVEFRERYNIGLALGCWHGEPAEEIQGDAGGIQDRRNYPTSSKASGISGVIPSGSFEEIEKLVWGNFGSKKSRARMPSKRSLGRRHTFCISLDFDQINFFTSSCPESPALPIFHRSLKSGFR